jgi:phenylalanyl-tRNA synthetase beta chain
VGTPAATWFQALYEDYLIEIGLTPNHMDAMSHWGVARDVCAWLSHHENKEYRPKQPSLNAFKIDNNSLPVSVSIVEQKGLRALFRHQHQRHYHPGIPAVDAG